MRTIMIPSQIKNGFFVMNDEIGKGSFGQVYAAAMGKNKVEVTIKFEPKEAKKKCLQSEIEVSLSQFRNQHINTN